MVDADQIAIDALGFIASDPDLMKRFLDLTGIEADGIREAAAAPGFFVGVLDFLLANENDVVSFGQASGVPIGSLQAARDKLDAGR
ncbi:DUF3572 domain-containing protein [Aureimonas sp. ME7]|uniref:DUF3572 domain-containing protein n=1 Tax=Aureimonas sp. ME7 TaxID=2744252 RepID=UPI0015FB4CA1|nr:DUF3572 domain-containing protein [Aureimonas sp. ME7]